MNTIQQSLVKLPGIFSFQGNLFNVRRVTREMLELGAVQINHNNTVEFDLDCLFDGDNASEDREAIFRGFVEKAAMPSFASPGFRESLNSSPILVKTFQAIRQIVESAALVLHEEVSLDYCIEQRQFAFRGPSDDDFTAGNVLSGVLEGEKISIPGQLAAINVCDEPSLDALGVSVQGCIVDGEYSIDVLNYGLSSGQRLNLNAHYFTLEGGQVAPTLINFAVVGGELPSDYMEVDLHFSRQNRSPVIDIEKLGYDTVHSNSNIVGSMHAKLDNRLGRVETFFAPRFYGGFVLEPIEGGRKLKVHMVRQLDDEDSVIWVGLEKGEETVPLKINAIYDYYANYAERFSEN